MKISTSTTNDSNHRRREGDDTNHPTSANDNLERSVDPSPSTIKHAEARQSNCDSIEAMQRRQIVNMSRIISDLEAKLIYREDEQRQLLMANEEERKEFAMSTEGALARIRYLEGMLRSLEMELKRLRSGRVTNNVAASATAATPTSPPRPVFLRDLSSDLVQDGASVCNTLVAKVEAELFSELQHLCPPSWYWDEATAQSAMCGVRGVHW